MKIYIASSWKNQFQPEVVTVLKNLQFEVYDFRHPAPDDNGFHWYNIDPGWEDWTTVQYTKALKHPIAQDGFAKDMNALRECDVCILVNPAGRSAHMEFGYAAGMGKLVFVLLPPDEKIRPDLMYLMARYICMRSELMVIELLRLREERVKAGKEDPIQIPRGI